jgi:hypothetical protein
METMIGSCFLQIVFGVGRWFGELVGLNKIDLERRTKVYIYIHICQGVLQRNIHDESLLDSLPPHKLPTMPDLEAFPSPGTHTAHVVLAALRALAAGGSRP